MSVTDKCTRLRELAELRQDTRWPGYNCIGDYHGGGYECEFVSPYTRSACNVHARVMILLQDWASDNVLAGPFLPERVTVGHDPRRPTNQRLRQLLRRHLVLELEQVYATNVFPFVKRGPMNAAIPKRDLLRAAREFALPQIEVVAPTLAVCLGKAAFNAVAAAAGARRAKSLADAIDAPFRFGGTQVWCQAHTGQLGTMWRNRSRPDQTEEDWARMASAYNKLRLA